MLMHWLSVCYHDKIEKAVRKETNTNSSKKNRRGGALLFSGHICPGISYQLPMTVCFLRVIDVEYLLSQILQFQDFFSRFFEESLSKLCEFLMWAFRLFSSMKMLGHSEHVYLVLYS